MVLPVLNVCTKDAHLAELNLELCAKFGCTKDATVVLSGDDADLIRKVSTVAQKAFKDVRILLYDKFIGEPQWPGPQNHAWQSVARNISEFPGSGWLWWEADAVPLRSGWLKALSEAHKRGKCTFTGVARNGPNGREMNGVGIWPMRCVDALDECAALYARQIPFDLAAAEITSRSLHDISDLIIYHKKLRGGGEGKWFDKESAKRFLAENSKAVLFHGCTDGSLAASLLGKSAPAAKIISTPRSGSAPLYSISVLCMNHRDLTEACVDSVIAHSGDNYELFITDNASTDDTPSYLRRLKNRLGDRVTIITNPENKGFQEPNTNALNLSRGQYFVLLNNDMTVCGGWLEGLRKPFENNPKIAITGISNTCTVINEDFKGRPPKPGQSPEYIEGSCLMIPAGLARKHGLFAPYLKFIYWEDTDLSLRMRELGYEIQTVDLPLNHNHRSSTTKGLDLRAVVEANHRAMWQEWGFYIKHRSFERNVHLKRLGARGDVLLLTPVISGLKRKWPQMTVAVDTKHPEMLSGYIDTSVSFPLNADISFDLNLSYESRPDVHITQAYADICGVTLPKDWKIEMVATPQDDAWATRVARGLKVALIHPGPTTWPGKNWPVGRFEQVVKWLQKKGFFAITVGAKDSPLCGCNESIVGSTPQQMYALARQASLFVGVDSMPQHIASAADIPSVVLFGATNPKCIVRQVPHILPIQASTKEAACVGAHGRRTSAVTFSDCDGNCMRAISTEMVMSAIEKLT